MERHINNTNIHVSVDTDALIHNRYIRLYSSIQPDDHVEILWQEAQRPLMNLIHPAEAFNQGNKSLKPAVMFNTYDPKLANSRRLQKQAQQKKKTEEYRKQRVTPVFAIKAQVDRKKMIPSGVDEFEDDKFLKKLPKKGSNKNAAKMKVKITKMGAFAEDGSELKAMRRRGKKVFGKKL
eukprot:Tbor_TRINITY_DN870_c0_g1::TRINITY_DN870_c0_g1_i1::g.26690::m.26690